MSRERNVTLGTSSGRYDVMVGAGAATDPAGRLALSYIEQNLQHEKLSVSAIARAAGASVTRLKAAFRAATGTSVHQYIIQRRVERARTLLTSGQRSISEIAQETGFAHQSHLTRHMRRILGYSPKMAMNGQSSLEKKIPAATAGGYPFGRR